MHLQSAFMFAKKKAWNDAIAHAKAARSDVLAKYFFWEYLKDPDAEASFMDISQFMDNNPDWPDTKLLLRRAEAALLSENPPQDQLDKWFRLHPPKTMGGKKRKMDDDELRDMIRQSWVDDDYSKSAEMKMLSNYRTILRAEDHARRIDRLLWEGRTEDAKRIFSYTSASKRQLFKARLALMQGSSRAPAEVSNVDSDLRSDPGLTYDRMRWRARNDDKDGARELLLTTPSKVPYPEKWWAYRERYIRELLNAGNVDYAEKLLARHAQEDGSSQLREAQWLKGWIALEFRNNGRAAYDTFQQLYDDLETPGSKSRAAYWAGRAAEKIGLQAGAWYKEAAKFNTTFYGQLALVEMSSSPMLKINSDDSEPSSDDRRKFQSRELVQLVKVLGKAKQSNLAGKFIIYMVENAKSTREAVLASRLGGDIKRIDIGVRASKKALKDGVVTLDSGYPVIRVPDDSGLEKPYLLALMRQESEFFADAVSSSGALGLMQLLPGTARETARKYGLLPFHADRLFEPNYNMHLGSRYLGALVTRFGGSYVLATASYNAGPGRVRQWVNAYGFPTGSLHAVVNWIEGMPLNETRNYVQHVMGNMQVYRYVLAGRKPTRLTLGDDLVAGSD